MSLRPKIDGSVHGAEGVCFGHFITTVKPFRISTALLAAEDAVTAETQCSWDANAQARKTPYTAGPNTSEPPLVEQLCVSPRRPVSAGQAANHDLDSRESSALGYTDLHTPTTPHTTLNPGDDL